jgi:hypothetical protein
LGFLHFSFPLVSLFDDRLGERLGVGELLQSGKGF